MLKYRHQLNPTDIPGVSNEYLNTLATKIVAKWQEEARLTVETRNQQLPLNADISKRTEGQSSAAVYELSLSSRSSTVARFIIRVHSGPQASEAAHREKDLVRHIANASTASDYFSATLYELEDMPNVVAYKHAADQLGEKVRSLLDSFSETVKKGKLDDAEALGAEIARMVTAVETTYGTLRPQRSISAAEYIDILEHRLPPDILIDTSGRTALINGTSMIIATESGDVPADWKSASRISLHEIAFALDRGEDLASRWIHLSVQRAEGDRPPYRAFIDHSGVRLWVKHSDSEWNGNAIILKADDPIVKILSSLLEERGIPRDAFPAIHEFRALLNKAETFIEIGSRHTDLHAKNVLCAPERLRLKVVDLGSADDDLLTVCRARLETSLIFEVSPAINIDHETAARLVNRTLTVEGGGQSAASPEAERLYSILSKLYSALPRRPQLSETLAYSSQVMLHLRYAIERAYTPGTLFIEYARFWFSCLNDSILSTPPLPIPTPQVEGGHAAGVNDLSDLWRFALQSPRLNTLTEKGSRFLESLRNTSAALLQSPLRPIQARLLTTEPHPFQSNRHLVIAAPTASGKSTIAEMFLTAPSILNQQRRCAIYIAPTRALTQAKHRELKARFGGIPWLEGDVLLSTGEDEDSDWRIRHGKFSIACMVYEKANILFSTNLRLIERISCLVIDEFHMLSNLERGPILEMALTKVLWERRRIDGMTERAPHYETLRVVAITTEEYPDASMQKLLSVRDAATGERLPPLIIHDPNRPVPVEHCLILRNSADGGSPIVFPFVEFSTSERRTLSIDELMEIEQKLDRVRGDEQNSFLSNAAADSEMKTRLNQFLADLIADHPRGYRVLIFVPSRRDAEEAAKRLKNTLRRRHGRDSLQQVEARYLYEDIVKQLRPHLDVAEDVRMADLLRKCAQVGIFVHHSDIDKKIRVEIENICAQADPQAGAQAIFATETLAYGVNLAINDVILLGAEFNTQTRFRVRKVELLTTCEFHNMMGRAGRHRTARKARAYIMVPPERDPFGIITNYYMSIERAESRLYVKDDREVQLRAEDNPFLTIGTHCDECSAYRSLGVLDFSYPFVRSVLDALRHVNSLSATGGGETKAPSQFDLLLEVLGNTLYASQFLKAETGGREAILFKCAVSRILNDCSREDLHLVEAFESGGNTGGTTLYSITARGEAIIDTGTEVHTVEPLLRLVSLLRDVWRRLTPTAGFFVPELYVLCILAQREVVRQVINYTPECRPYRYWPSALVEENRNLVLRRFEESLGKVATTQPLDSLPGLALSIRCILDDWEPLRMVNQGYIGGATDGLLRLYCGIISWINLEERAEVDAVIEGRDLPDNFQGRMLGFRQFTDLISWKILFLAKILVTSTSGEIPFDAEQERNLHLLASRLRLGCTSQAIPLFWPFSSDFRRPEARRLLAAGANPTRILSMRDPKDLLEEAGDISPAKIERLREDLEKYAKTEFEELESEMTVVREVDDARRESINWLWGQVSDAITTAIQQFRNSRRDVPSVGADDLLRRGLGFDQLLTDQEGRKITYLSGMGRGKTEDVYRIRVDSSTFDWGIALQGEQIVLDSDEGWPVRRPRTQRQRQHTARVLGVQFRQGWQCSLKEGEWINFEELLKQCQEIPHLVIASVPWTPLAEEMSKEVGHLLMSRARDMGFTTVFMSSAAVLLLFSSVVRGFIASEACMKLLVRSSAPDGNPYSFLGVSDVQAAIDSSPDRQMPPSIREKVLRHFEVRM